MPNTPTVMIIRHGEKPIADGDRAYVGINLTGVSTKPSNGPDLIPQGWMRCGALGRFFWPLDGAPVSGIWVPTNLYASASKETCEQVFSYDPKYPGTFPQPPLITPQGPNPNATSSLREQELLLAVSALTGLAINDRYIAGSGESELASEVAGLPSASVALIAWEHSNIPGLATAMNTALNANIPPGIIPTKWDSWRFDLVWVFSYNSASGAWNFAQIPQNLLPGDINGPMGALAS